MGKWWDTIQSMADSTIPELIEDALDGARYVRVLTHFAADFPLVIVWKGGSAVDAYEGEGWKQISHWHIEYSTDPPPLPVVMQNIQEHIDNDYWPN